MKKIFKYILVAVFSIVVSKWIILEFIPSSYNSNIVENRSDIKMHKEREEVELKIDYTVLSEDIEEEFKSAKVDIDQYIEEEIEDQKSRCYNELSRDDGFLDWIFGYFTGYKMMWKKLKGFFGSDDNEIKMVSDKFQKDIIDKNYNTMIGNIQDYAKNRIDDSYKSVLALTTEHINHKVKELKTQGYGEIKTEKNNIPWGKYLISQTSDGFVVAELTGITSVSLVAGKVVGAKVAALLGPKMLALVGAKTATVVAGKIASAFSLIFAPLVDWGLNEGSKMYQYNDTKKDFEHIVDGILSETKSNIKQKTDQVLAVAKKSIYDELNRQTTIRGVK